MAKCIRTTDDGVFESAASLDQRMVESAKVVPSGTESGWPVSNVVGDTTVSSLAPRIDSSVVPIGTGSGWPLADVVGDTTVSSLAPRIESVFVSGGTQDDGTADSADGVAGAVVNLFKPLKKSSIERNGSVANAETKIRIDHSPAGIVITKVS